VRFTLRLARDAIERGDGLKRLKGKEARTTLGLPSWRDYHRARARARQRIGARAAASAYGFPLDQHPLRCRRGNVEGQAWHELRHTYSGLFFEAGGLLEEEQSSLSHSSIQATEAYYGHCTEDAAATLARLRIYGVAAGAPSARSGGE
jgi:integrase